MQQLLNSLAKDQANCIHTNSANIHEMSETESGDIKSEVKNDDCIETKQSTELKEVLEKKKIRYENQLNNKGLIKLEDTQQLLNSPITDEASYSYTDFLETQEEPKIKEVDIKIEVKDENCIEDKYSIELEDIEIKSEDGDRERFQDSSLSLKSPMYQSEVCTYSTKSKGHLNLHMVIHKSNPEVTIYKCDKCLYETKLKRCLIMHMLKHKDISEVRMYLCDICPFETKYKCNLKKHLNGHCESSRKKLKCKDCPYETNSMKHYSLHMQTHVDDVEVRAFRCEQCSYITMRMFDLKRHWLIHKSDSERTVYECELCPYKTKYIKCLTKHLLKHKNNESYNI